MSITHYPLPTIHYSVSRLIGPPVPGDSSRSSTGDVLIYETDDRQVEVRLEQDPVWLNRQQMAELFGRDVKTIGKHINNVFKEGELPREATVAKFATVQNEGGREVTRQVEYYNLDVIISVGYRVKSLQGTRFRIWATQRLRDYLVKGYALNRQRLEQNARELEQALKLARTAARSPALDKDASREVLGAETEI